jgi:hypothetical protein
VPEAAQALANEILVDCLAQVAALSRLGANIATHNEREEFDFPIRSSTMENTCSGTFLKHYEFTGSFEAIWRTVGSLSGFGPQE